MRITRIRLSDKTSRLRPRHVVPKPAQTYEPEVPVEVREWIAPAPSSPDFVLEANVSKNRTPLTVFPARVNERKIWVALE